MKNKKKILALIPTRLNSRRLPAKALLPINNLPLVMHVYKRVKLAKKIDEVIICCDDNKILKVVKKYGAKAILTSKHHNNGTDRICEAYKKIEKNYNFILDVQGDEPLISPAHIDKVIEFHKKNLSSDIILPNQTFEVEHRWSGIMGVGNQKKAIVKQKSNNVFCGIRLGGMGVAIGSLVGKELAELIN